MIAYDSYDLIISLLLNEMNSHLEFYIFPKYSWYEHENNKTRTINALAVDIHPTDFAQWLPKTTSPPQQPNTQVHYS